ncbi:MAG: GGDEF domain-containing protein [Anaerovibrio sp.]|uniref:GGDEF domain-containing protein n=1 Tax=Anaerovibrio sp. TaxID=1872532 RepID=UPI0025DEE0EF|nr:GGDEF domain-containing protein [Anaerovibrio sp.]MCR5175616.1 GGDEF domain-containing protein [Anaerovibrio sp.]
MDTFINEALFYFKFDVSTRVVKDDIVDKFGNNYMKQFGLQVPCSFDEVINRFVECGYADIMFMVGMSIKNITCDGLLTAFAEGQNYVESSFYKPDNGRHYRLMYILERDDITGHVLATVMCTDVTDIEKMRLHSLTKSLYSAQKQAEDLEYKLKIIHSMSQFYKYIYYCDLESEVYREVYCDSDYVHDIMGEVGNIHIAIRDMCRLLVKPEYTKEVNEFTDFTTLKKRLKGKKFITKSFEGPYTGWLESVFFPVEVSDTGNFTQVIFALRDISYEKERENQLIYNSYVDELTKLYNRKMFNENLLEYVNGGIPNNLVLFSIDVNGLKVVNDTLGHAAGDELLCGVADCLRNAFKQHGKIFRLGGDEYAAIIYVSPENRSGLINHLEHLVKEWHGSLVDKISISYGYVTKEECHGKTIYEMAKLADKKMYKSKEEYYSQKGVDRRGMNSARDALGVMYYKVIKVNVLDDSYQIVHMDEKMGEDLKRPPKASDLVESYVRSGYIHPDDVDKFINGFNHQVIREFFASGKKCYSFSYKRKINGRYRAVKMELVPSDGYGETNNTLFCYIKKRTR